jgi:O-antigen ligase
MTLPRAAWSGQLGVNLPWLALLPLALMPVLGPSATSLNMLLFATEVLLLAAGVRRPVWIPAALLVNELTSANYMHDFGVSNRLLLALLSIPVLAPHIAARVELGRKARATVLLGLAFVLLTTASNMIYAEDGYVIQFLRYIAVGLYILVLIPITIRDREDLRDLCVLLFGVAALSATVGIFQHWSSSRGTPIWQTIPHAGAPGETFASWEERVVALTNNPIHAGNTLMVAGLFALGAILVAPMSSNLKRGIALTLLMMAVASYFTYTRSWAIAMVPALVSIALLYRGQYKKEFWLLIIVMMGAVWYWSDMKATRYTADASEDGGSASARPVLWSVGLNIALDHPWLGVGHDAYLELSPEYAKTLDDDLLESPEARSVIGKYTPHNDLLNIWLSWGFFSLLVYVIFSIAIGRNFVLTFITTADPLLKGLALGGLAALIGFQVNSLFHNFFDSTLTLWVLGGFSLVALKLGPHAPIENAPEPQPIVLVRDRRGEWETCPV